MGLFRVIIYGIILGVYAGSLAYDIQYLPRFSHTWWIGKLVMLSVLNLTLQTVYAGICFVCSLFDWNEEVIHAKKSKHVTVLPSYWRQTKLHKICDFFYATSVFPVGIATCLLYWSLYLVDPQLVGAAWSARFIPPWMDQVEHTAPIVFILIDTLLTCHHAPSRKMGSVVVFALFLFYLAIILAVKQLQGVWLYPIFDHISNQQRAIFLALCGVMFWFLYLIGDGLNFMVWGEAPHAAMAPTKKQH